MIHFIRKYLLAGSKKSEAAPYVFIIVLIYAIGMLIYVGLFFDSYHLFVRLILNSFLVVSFIVLERSRLSVAVTAFAFPTLFMAGLTTASIILKGDFLMFIYSTGAAMISLTYLKPKAITAYVSVYFTVSAVILFVFGINLLGVSFSHLHNILYLIVITAINVLICIFCKSYTSTFNALSESRKKTEEANKSKSRFLADMSHEIRTPMNAIIGVAQIELQKTDLPKEYAAAFEKIYGSGNNLLGIINDILDMSKIETGKLELIPVEYNVPSLINDTVQLNIVRIGSKQINFKMDIDENLPSTLYGDELRIKQVLNNLLSNAIKYTENGYIKLSVSHEIKDEATMLRFAVEDTGQGIKPEDQERLFAEFVRFNADKNRTTEGTGLGLSIAKRLVEMMDGTIAVESEYGKGSTFIVTIRQKTVDCSSIGAELVEILCSFKFVGNRQDEKLRITHDVMPYGRVLIVDDVEMNLYVAESLMAPYRLNTETVSSGFAAIDKIKCGNTYDVIFMDHMMPQMDGIETTQKLRALGYAGVIVALTANALVGNDEMFAQNGFDGFIPKPIDIRQLNEVLNTFIRDRHPEEAEKYKAETAVQEEMTAVSPKLIKVFLHDASKAIATLQKTASNGDIKLLTTTAHAMKSALANIGEHDASALASELESAGQSSDTEFIAENTGAFIETLSTLIETLASDEIDDIDEKDIMEDAAYLSEQLLIVKTACGDYDVEAACAVLNRLKEKPWKAQTAKSIDNIYDILYLESDFDRAAEMIVNLLE